MATVCGGFRNGPYHSLQDRVRRAVLLNPAFLGAVLLSILFWTAYRPALPEALVDLDAPVELTGTIAGLPTIEADQIALRLRPREVRRRGERISLPGEIDLYIQSGTGNPGAWFDPPLRFGERVRFTGHLREPRRYDVPDAVDPRWSRWVKGRYYYASLKSPLQLERVEGEPSGLDLLFALPFRYMEQFLAACDRLDPFPSAILRASLGGDPQRLDAKDWDRFQQLGLVHLLVVSGFHVALIAFASGRLLLPFGHFGALLRLLLIWAFVAVTGGASPALRAALTISLYLLSSQAALQARPFNLLGIAALALLAAHPVSLYTRSFQFTFAAVLGILAARPSVRILHAACRGLDDFGTSQIRLGRRPRDRIRRRARFIAESRLQFVTRHPGFLPLRLLGLAGSYFGSLLLVCVTVQSILLPLLLYHTNQAPLSGVVNNLLFVPPFTLFLVLGFLYLAFFWSPFSGLLVPAVNHAGSSLAGALSLLERGNLTVAAPSPPTWLTILLCGAVAALPLVGPGRRPLLLALPLLALVPLSRPPADGHFSATLLDVGQSEAIHLSYPDGSQALIDTGGSSLEAANRFLGRQVVARYLLNSGIRELAFVLITHPEADHRGCYPEILRLVRVASTLHGESAAPYPGDAVRLHEGLGFTLGGVEHRILNPSTRPGQSETNADSIVLLVRYREFRMLFTGDIPASREERLLPGLSPVEVLKVSHHGSRSSSGPRFLERLRPTLGLISAGRRNPFGHPDPVVVRRLALAGCLPLSTADFGTLRVRTDGYRWELDCFTVGQGRFRPLRAGTCSHRVFEAAGAFQE